jgi:hypothetical protein
MGGNERVAATMVLAAGAGEPIVCQLSSMVQSALRSEKKTGLRRADRLRDHAAEELPLRVVAAAAEAAGAGQPVAAVHRHGLSDRGVAAVASASRSCQTSSCASRAKQAMSH